QRGRGRLMAATRVAQWGNDLYTGARSYEIVAHRHKWYAITAVIVVACIGLLLFRGLNPSIDVSGGSEFTVNGVSDTSQQPAIDAMASVRPDDVPRVAVVGGSSLRVQTVAIEDKAEADRVREALAAAYVVPVSSVDSNFVG